jgi:hypothetical protein
VVLHARKADLNNPLEYLTYTLSNAKVSGYQTGPPGVVGDAITLSFSRIREDFTLQAPDGSPGTPVTVTYDLATNTGGASAIAPAGLVQVTVVSNPFNVKAIPVFSALLSPSIVGEAGRRARAHGPVGRGVRGLRVGGAARAPARGAGRRLPGRVGPGGRDGAARADEPRAVRPDFRERGGPGAGQRRVLPGPRGGRGVRGLRDGPRGGAGGRPGAARTEDPRPFGPAPVRTVSQVLAVLRNPDYNMHPEVGDMGQKLNQYK